MNRTSKPAQACCRQTEMLVWHRPIKFTHCMPLWLTAIQRTSRQRALMRCRRLCSMRPSGGTDDGRSCGTQMPAKGN